MSIFTQFSERWKADTPTFFKKVKKIALALGAPATSVLAIASTTNIIVPVIIIKIASYILVACAGMGITAQLTKTDTPT